MLVKRTRNPSFEASAVVTYGAREESGCSVADTAALRAPLAYGRARAPNGAHEIVGAVAAFPESDGTKIRWPRYHWVGWGL